MEYVHGWVHSGNRTDRIRSLVLHVPRFVFIGEESAQVFRAPAALSMIDYPTEVIISINKECTSVLAQEN